MPSSKFSLRRLLSFSPLSPAHTANNTDTLPGHGRSTVAPTWNGRDATAADAPWVTSILRALGSVRGVAGEVSRHWHGEAYTSAWEKRAASLHARLAAGTAVQRYARATTRARASSVGRVVPDASAEGGSARGKRKPRGLRRRDRPPARSPAGAIARKRDRPQALSPRRSVPLAAAMSRRRRTHAIHSPSLRRRAPISVVWPHRPCPCARCSPHAWRGRAWSLHAARHA